MSKICKNCGVRHENSAKKCIACGAEFGDEHIYAKKKKQVILAVCCILLLTIAIGLVMFFTGPKAAVRRIMNAHKRNDFEAVVEAMPDLLLESDKLDYDQFMLTTERTVEVFSQYIFSFNIEKAETPNANEREWLMDALRYFGEDSFDEAKVTDVKIVWVRYKGNVPGFWPSRGTRFLVFKYDGEWTWWPSNVNW